MKKKKKLKLITSEDAKPATSQHTKPCSDCPFARDALPGWLGTSTAEEWRQMAHGETWIECHVHTGVQCAGASIYRANVAKTPRDKTIMRLPADPKSCFVTPMEFLEHHRRIEDVFNREKQGAMEEGLGEEEAEEFARNIASDEVRR